MRTGVVLEENDLSASYAGKALINRTTADIILTRNWYGLADQLGDLAKLTAASTGTNTVRTFMGNASFSKIKFC
ncbi:hypothetical protein [Dyadobacter tibetensis]|uniref:hypothetical protein n=1 Tax=Dyadobacter tibetensis TaxID=1211851 RepID=UPI000471206C|nr:hypothetical protein [Dyadobacter tibetensis]